MGGGRRQAEQRAFENVFLQNATVKRICDVLELTNPAFSAGLTVYKRYLDLVNRRASTCWGYFYDLMDSTRAVRARKTVAPHPSGSRTTESGRSHSMVLSQGPRASWGDRVIKKQAYFFPAAILSGGYFKANGNNGGTSQKTRSRVTTDSRPTGSGNPPFCDNYFHSYARKEAR